MSKLSTILKKLLNQANLKESELARRTGVAQQIINRIISGENTNPKLITLQKISNYFMIPISQLVGDESIDLTNIQVSAEHLGWAEIPILNLSDISKRSLNKLLKKNHPTLLSDIESNGVLFATNTNDDSMDPKFPVNSILIFDAKQKPVNGDFVLIEQNIPSNEIKFRQVFFRNNKMYSRCVNPSHEDYNAEILDDTSIIIGVLIQSRVDFKNLKT